MDDFKIQLPRGREADWSTGKATTQAVAMEATKPKATNGEFVAEEHKPSQEKEAKHNRTRCTAKTEEKRGRAKIQFVESTHAPLARD